MLALRTEEGLDIAAYRREFGSEFVLDFEEALVKNKEYFDLVGGKRVKIKDEYLYVQNHILMDFLK